MSEWNYETPKTVFLGSRSARTRRRHLDRMPPVWLAQGLLIHAIVHAADIQDRDRGAFVMATMVSTRICRFLPLIFFPAS